MWEIFQLKNITTGGILLGASLVSYGLNFLFNAYLGRVLPLEEFGVLTLLATFWYLILIVINAMSATVNHEVSYLHKQKGEAQASSYFHFFYSKTFQIAIACSLLWLIATPFIMSFFRLHDPLTILMFVPLIICGALMSINRGYLQGTLAFVFVAISLVAESFSRLLLAIIFTNVGGSAFVYLTIPLSVLVGFITSIYFVNKIILAKPAMHEYSFPRKFFFILLLTGISSTAFLTIDIVLVKHFFNSAEAGSYALLTLVGKVIFFLGSLLNGILFTIASRRRDGSYSMFYIFLAATTGLVTMSLLAFGVFGEMVMPLLFGEKSRVIFPYLLPYSLAISSFTLSYSFVLFHLALKQYLFAIVASVMALALSLGIFFFHRDLLQVVNTTLTVSAFGLVTILLMHIYVRVRML